MVDVLPGYYDDAGVWIWRHVSHPLVVHCKKEPFDVYIGRPGKFGNPFKLRDFASREECLSAYKTWLLSSDEGAIVLHNAVRELKGKRLGCWCAPLPCHGDIPAKIVNG